MNRIIERYKKVIKSIVAVVVCLGIMFDMCACEIETTSGQKATVVAYIIDKTKYSPVYDFGKLFEESITSYFEVKGSKAIVIEADQSPRLVDSFTSDGKDPFASSNSNKRALNKEAKKVIECMNNITPDEGELDVIKAIAIAVDELNVYSKDTNKQIVIVSSFLNTCNPLNMTEGGLSHIDEEGIVESLISKNCIETDMSEITVDLYGVGRVTSGLEQSELTNPEKSKVENLCRSLFEGCAVVDCEVHSDTPNGEVDMEYKKTLPSVTPVATDNIDNEYEPIQVEEIDENKMDLKTCVLQFPEGSSLSFKAGSADYITSEEDIERTLRPVVEWAKKNPDEKLAIFAATASAGTVDELLDLSRARAEAVMNSLTTLGLNEDSIEIYPLGYEMNPYKHEDTVDGVFIEEEGCKNRVVYITTTSSPAADVFYDSINSL